MKANFNLLILEGYVTHTPEYYPEKGQLLCFAIAVNNDHISKTLDSPMYLDIKVSGISEAQAKAVVQGHEVRVIGQLQSKTWKRGDESSQRYFHLYVSDPMMLTLLAKPKRNSDDSPTSIPTLPELSHV